jgi:hypothetical protein
MELPESPGDDTTAGQGGGRSSAARASRNQGSGSTPASSPDIKQKGGPKTALSVKAGY